MGQARTRSRALHHVIVFALVICHFVGAHGGIKTSKGQIPKNMFLWWAGPPKVGKWPFLGFHKLKNLLFNPYFESFMAKSGVKCLFSCLKRLMNICGIYTDYIWEFLGFSNFLTLWVAIFGSKSVIFDPLESKMTDFGPKMDQNEGDRGFSVGKHLKTCF